MSRPTGNTPFPQRARSLAMRQYGGPVTKATSPIPVHVWLLSVDGEETEVQGMALAWTPRAVHVRYIDRHQREDSAWVWAGAVRRAQPERAH